MPLAVHEDVGRLTPPVVRRANHLPVRPQPVITSSAMSSTPRSWRARRAAAGTPCGGTSTPLVPTIGSMITAATFSSCSIMYAR